MSPEDQRIAIALHLGAKWQTNGSGWTYLTFGSVWDVIPAPLDADKIVISSSVPDYLNDLNAMYEAEKVLVKTNNWDRYFHLLRDLTSSVIHATAEQKSQAFLRTLNLWKESE